MRHEPIRTLMTVYKTLIVIRYTLDDGSSSCDDNASCYDSSPCSPPR